MGSRRRAPRRWLNGQPRGAENPWERWWRRCWRWWPLAWAVDLRRAEEDKSLLRALHGEELARERQAAARTIDALDILRIKCALEPRAPVPVLRVSLVVPEAPWRGSRAESEERRSVARLIAAAVEWQITHAAFLEWEPPENIGDHRRRRLQ